MPGPPDPADHLTEPPSPLNLAATVSLPTVSLPTEPRCPLPPACSRRGVRWIVQHPLYSHKLTTFDRAPSYTRRGSVISETTHKVNLSENLFRQMILYGKRCKIPSRHQKSLGNSVQVWHLESKDFLCRAPRGGGSGQSVPGGRTHLPGTLQTHGDREERPPQRRTVD